MGNTWFTLDSHFGHGRIIETCTRPFADSAEADAEIIRRWNLVAPADTVRVLGDGALGDRIRGLEIVSEPSGTKRLLEGNRDACWPGRIGARKYPGAFLAAGVASVAAFARVKLPATIQNAPARKALLSHFPYGGFGQRRPLLAISPARRGAMAVARARAPRVPGRGPGHQCRNGCPRFHARAGHGACPND